MHKELEPVFAMLFWLGALVALVAFEGAVVLALAGLCRFIAWVGDRMRGVR